MPLNDSDGGEEEASGKFNRTCPGRVFEGRPSVNRSSTVLSSSRPNGQFSPPPKTNTSTPKVQSSFWALGDASQRNVIRKTPWIAPNKPTLNDAHARALVPSCRMAFMMGFGHSSDAWHELTT